MYVFYFGKRLRVYQHIPYMPELRFFSLFDGYNVSYYPTDSPFFTPTDYFMTLTLTKNQFVLKYRPLFI